MIKPIRLLATDVLATNRLYCAPTDMLAAFINPIIDKLEADERRFSGRDRNTGTINQIAADASTIKGTSIEAAKRRLYDIRYQTGQTCDAEWAEVFLIALGSSLEEASIPVFPSIPRAAVEMAAVWADDDLQRKYLESALIRFSVGFFYDLDDVCARLEKELAA